MKSILFITFFLCLLLLFLIIPSKEGYYKLERKAYTTDNSFFDDNIQTERCFDLYNISNIHSLGFDPWRCNTLPPSEFADRISAAEKCRNQCNDDNCRGACYAREFVRNPIFDQTALPLIMS